MNHQEHHEEVLDTQASGCCGGHCCDSDEAEIQVDKAARCEKVKAVFRCILLLGAFVFSLLTFLMLPRMVEKEMIKEQALKAGGMENYERLNKEVYETEGYKTLMKAQVNQFIEENKITVDMYMKQQEAAANGQTAQPQIDISAEDAAAPEQPAGNEEQPTTPAQ